MSNKLIKRSEADQQLKWDLKLIFKNEDEFNKAKVQVKELVDQFVKDYQGNLTNALIILESIKTHEAIISQLQLIHQYSYLPVSVDITDADAQERARNTASLIAEISATLSFYHSELMEVAEETLDAVVSEDNNYEPFISDIKKAKDHKLHPEVEKALASLSPVLNSFDELYEQARSADPDYGSFLAEGTEYPLSFVTYEEQFMYSESQEIRRESYDQFNDILGQYKNTVGTIYYTHVQKEKILATMRGYDSVFDYLLEDQDVSQELYHRQIDMIMNDFAPVMRKYITHVKEVNGLDKMTYADLKMDLDPEYTESLTIEESKEVVKNATSILGEDYVDIMMKAFDERWIDFASNIGKRSGAFCSKTYESRPYIMLSWSGLLSDAYTLLHELGHAGQGYLSDKEQVKSAARPSLYLIEAPSTFNELLLTDYLRQEASNPRSERSIISKMISKTYFHNFVTHLLEAAYQREVYRLIDQGKGFDANILSKLKRQVLEEFWGDAVEIEPGAELTWMRQIHYYMGLYPYTYSAGLTIATQAFLKLKNGEITVEDWLAFLKLGGTKKPLEAAKVAGVNVDTEQPLSDTIKYLDESIDQMIQLSNEITE